MIKGDFELTRQEDGSYLVRHTPTNAKLGRIVKAWRGFESKPPTKHYRALDSKLENVAQAMLHEAIEFGKCPYKKMYDCHDCKGSVCPLH